MAAELHRAHHQLVALNARHQFLQLHGGEGLHAGGVVAVEAEQHAAGQLQIRLGSHRRSRGHDRRRCHGHGGPALRRRSRCNGGCLRRGAGFGQLARFTQQVLSRLHIGLGMAPLLLVLLVAGMHQFHLAAGQLLLGATEAGMALEGRGTFPQVRPHARGVVDERGFHRQGTGTALHALDELFALAQRGLGEGAAVVARVLVQAHVQPALGLAEVIVADRAAAVTQALDTHLQRFVGLVVGLDGRIADAVLGRCERGRGLREQHRAGQGQGGGQGQGADLSHRSRLLLTCGSRPLKRFSSNLNRKRR